MNKELKNAVEAADAKAQYDECAKRLLGLKSILSYIFAHTIEAFQGMKPKEIIPYIEGDEAYTLHRLLGTLFSEELTVVEKLNILEEEYDIPIEENLEKEVNYMCNLGEGIEERALERGITVGEARGEPVFARYEIFNIYIQNFI